MCNITKIYCATCSKDELLLYSEYSGEWADGPEPIESSHHHRRQFWSVKRSHGKQVKMVRSRLYSKVFVNKNIELQRWSIWAGIQDWDEQRAAPPVAASGNNGRHSSSSCRSRLKSRDPADELMVRGAGGPTKRIQNCQRVLAASPREPSGERLNTPKEIDWAGARYGAAVSGNQASDREAHICRNDELSWFPIKLTNFPIPKRSNEVTKHVASSHLAIGGGFGAEKWAG
ncbi:hypothetical protein B0H14DRAFT_2641221 [Mycena olivaceomarginata]|nr:hypothetical protein B0H14DRAFT_2641221 [Mycena olivaceomarginata]